LEMLCRAAPEEHGKIHQQRFAGGFEETMKSEPDDGKRRREDANAAPPAA